jgi:hypothetical protein
MVEFMQLLPYWFYLAGSLCFLVGTAVVIWRAYR